jgi:hypothetical protein
MEFANANKVYRKSGGSPSNALSLYQTAGKISEKASPQKKILKGTGFRTCVRTPFPTLSPAGTAELSPGR